MNFFCEKRLYEGDSFTRREYKPPCVGIFTGLGTVQFGGGTDTKVYVKRFLVEYPLDWTVLRGRFLMHALGWHFKVVKTEPGPSLTHNIKLEVFAISQEEANKELDLIKEAVNVARNLDATALEDEAKRARAIRHEGGNARNRRSRRRKLLRKPAWWEQLGGGD